MQIFFKHLTSSNDVAVAMSQDGLTAAIAHHKMPKTLLQARAGSAPHALHALLPLAHAQRGLLPQCLSFAGALVQGWWPAQDTENGCWPCFHASHKALHGRRYIVQYGY